MKHKYLLTACLLAMLSQQVEAQTTAWRPFRPGRIYTFAQVGAIGNPIAGHTLRVDSAYATAGGDSVYTFNRLLRQPNTSLSLYRKSRNNLFGARLRWQPGTSNYYLETNAEPALNGASTPTVLLLKPRAAVGSSWTASTLPALTATLSSRVAVGSAADSLATFTLSNGQQLTMSKYNGLSQGPQWLTLPAVGAVKPSDWYQLIAPQAGLGAYDPRQLFAMQPGALLGYYLEYSPVMNPIGCGSGNLLRQILTRQQTTDSLIITYQEQQRFTYSGAPTCSNPAGTVVSPVQRGRWAFSLSTGASPQFPALALLSQEYRPIPNTGSLQILNASCAYSLNTATNTSRISYIRWYGQTYLSTIVYGPLVDSSNGIDFTTGLGPTATYDDFKFQQNFYCPGGSVCMLPPAFTSLLPSRAAQAAAAATLHPNPATDAATLTLVAPTQPNSILTLTDALGRHVWSTEPTPGQTVLTLPLAGQAPGLYLVQLLTANAAPLTWKLHKQ